MISRHRITFSLLEDLHTGAGVGNAAVDALVARDRDGHPCLYWSHLKGVLRSTADLLSSHGALKVPVDRIFGRPNADTSGCVTLTSAWSASGKPIQTIRHTSVARRTGSRMPLDDSLRVIEFVPGGSEFTSEVELPDAHLDDFKRILAGTDCLGADRRRGDGLVHICIEPVQRPRPRQLETIRPGTTIRLLLRALDPISMPTTSDPSSSRIQGESYIRGQTLAGALAAACFDAHHAVSSSVFERRLRVGDALPLPITAPDRINDLRQIDVLPAPRHYRSAKVTTRHGELPWWVNDHDLPLVAGAGWRYEDLLMWRQGDGPWEWYRSPTRQRLRLQVPSRSNGLTIGQPELFAQHEIAERTLFVADITLPNDERLSTDLNHWLQTGSWLRIGRGARPVEVLAVVENKSVVEVHRQQLTESGAFLLASDLILREEETLETLPWLQPDEASVLARTVGAGTVSIPRTLNGLDVHGFNGISRLPRQPEYALARGGAFLASGDVAAVAGERAHEGFGRISRLPTGLVLSGTAHDGEAAEIPAFTVSCDREIDGTIERDATVAHGIFLARRADLARTSRSVRSTLRALLARQQDDAAVVRTIEEFSRAGTRRAGLICLSGALKDHAEEHASGRLAALAVWVLDWSLAYDRDAGEER